jgi:hypothetical protein
MAVAKVQRTQVQGSSLVENTTTPAFSGSTTTGNGMDVKIACYDPTGSPSHAVTDNKSNIYTPKESQSMGSNLYSLTFTCNSITGGASHTVTFSSSGGTAIATVVATEISGTGGVIVDDTSKNFGSGTAASDSVTITGAGLVLGMVTHSGSGTITPTTGTEDYENETASSTMPVNLVLDSYAAGARTVAWTVPASTWGVTTSSWLENGGGAGSSVPVIMNLRRQQRA